MANKKEIKRRIRSVKNIGQITKALQMVSAVKMRKAQEAVKNADGYYKVMQDIFSNFLDDLDQDEIKNLFSDKKTSTNTIGIIIISPSMSFAGSLLSNLLKATLDFIEKRAQNLPYSNDEFILFHEEENSLHAIRNENEMNVQLITVEKKSKDIAFKLRKSIIADFPKLSNPPRYEDITPISSILFDSFSKGNISELYIVYTHFLSTFSQKAVVKKLLPFSTSNTNNTEGNKEEKKKKLWYTYSNTKIDLFSELYPLYIENQLFHSVLDAAAAEHSARMIAMKNATDNAVELRKELTFEYNQKRQASITQEIAEITSASETI